VRCTPDSHCGGQLSGQGHTWGTGRTEQQCTRHLVSAAAGFVHTVGPAANREHSCDTVTGTMPLRRVQRRRAGSIGARQRIDASPAAADSARTVQPRHSPLPVRCTLAHGMSNGAVTAALSAAGGGGAGATVGAATRRALHPAEAPPSPHPLGRLRLAQMPSSSLPLCVSACGNAARQNYRRPSPVGQGARAPRRLAHRRGRRPRGTQRRGRN